MQFKITYLYYIIGVIVTIIIYGLDKAYFLFLLLGFGVGILLHNWIKGLYDDTINAFFTSELRKRQMEKRELEQKLDRLNEIELERLKEGD